MGKGDRRTRRGKIYNGSFGKLRPKKDEAKGAKPAVAAVAKAAPAAKAKPAAKAPARKKAAG